MNEREIDQELVKRAPVSYTHLDVYKRQTASRPWDKDRDGFVLAEGAGVMVLEEYENAKARGARIYGELAGFGMSADAHHMTAPCEDGERSARCMTCLLYTSRCV